MTRKAENNKKIAAGLSIAHGVITTIFLMLNNYNLFGFRSFIITQAKNNNEAVVNAFMIAQLVILLISILAVVFAIIGKQADKMIWYMATVAIAGLDATILLFMGEVTVLAPFCVLTGVMMLRNKKEINADDFEFGGEASGLSQEKGMSSLIDNEQENKL